MAAGMAKIRIYLVDDHEMVREGLKLMLSHYDDIAIVGDNNISLWGNYLCFYSSII